MPAMRRLVRSVAPCLASQRVPLLLRAAARAADQHELGPVRAREALCEREADAAETARHEVDAALAQPACARRPPERRRARTLPRSGLPSRYATTFGLGRRRELVDQTLSREAAERRRPAAASPALRLREPEARRRCSGSARPRTRAGSRAPAPSTVAFSGCASGSPATLCMPFETTATCSGQRIAAIAERLHQEEQAVEAALLVAVQEARSGPEALVGGDGPEGARPVPAAGPARDERGDELVVAAATRLGRERVLAVAEAVEGVARRTVDDVVSRGAQPSRRQRSPARPRRGRRASVAAPRAPRRAAARAATTRALNQLAERWRCARAASRRTAFAVRRPARLDPVALVLEGVGRQRTRRRGPSPRSFANATGTPAIQSRPKLATAWRRSQTVSLGLPQRRDDRARASPAAAGASEQSVLAGADLEQHAVRLAQQLREAVARSAPSGAGAAPSSRGSVASLGPHPGAGQVRDERDARRREPDPRARTRAELSRIGSSSRASGRRRAIGQHAALDARARGERGVERLDAPAAGPRPRTATGAFTTARSSVVAEQRARPRPRAAAPRASRRRQRVSTELAAQHARARSASSSEITPARHAAAYSPMLWPISAAGSTPQRHPELRQRVLDGEERGQLQRRPLELRRGSASAARGRG